MDWKGLLNWTLNYQDGTTNKNLKPMSEEDQKFLTDALESVCINEMKEVMKILDFLYEPEKDEEDIEKRCESLEYLLELLDSPENARNIVRAKRFPILINYFFFTNNKKVKLLLASVLASMMQNDKFVQSAAIDLGIFKFLELINTTEDKELSSKYVYMLTGLLYGEFERSKKLFLEDFDGMKLLFNVLIKSNPFGNTESSSVICFRRALSIIKELTKIEEKSLESYEIRFIAMNKIEEINIHNMIVGILSKLDFNTGDNVQIINFILEILVNIVRVFDSLDILFKQIQELNVKLTNSTYLNEEEIKNEKIHLIEVLKNLKEEFCKIEDNTTEENPKNDENIQIDNNNPKGSMCIQLKK